MFGIAVRGASRWAIVASLVVAGALAAASRSHEPADERDESRRQDEILDAFARYTGPLEVTHCTFDKTDPGRDAAALAYQDGRFDDAAELVSRIRPTDVDLQNLALQYERFGRAWRVAMKPTSPSIAAFEALAEARKLDVVLGGELELAQVRKPGARANLALGRELVGAGPYTGVLEARMRVVAPRAALAYMTGKDYRAAELALHTAENLGVHDATVARIRDQLAAVLGPE